MPTLNLTSYPRETLEHVLSIVKSYRISMKQIGKRAILTDPLDPPQDSVTIEYAPHIDASLIEKYSEACLALSFPEYKSTLPPIIRKNPLLTGGIRLFVGDDMVDVSFARFESLVK